MNTAAIKRDLARSRNPDPPAPKRRGRGRPSDFEPWMIQRAGELALNGATVLEIAKDLSVAEATVYNWMNEYPDFLEAVKRGGASFDRRVETRLQHRVLGGTKTTQLFDGEGKTVSTKVEEIVPSDRAIEMWLYNRQRKRWRPPRQETELVVPVADETPQLSDEDADIRKLALAALALMREAETAPMIEGEASDGAGHEADADGVPDSGEDFSEQDEEDAFEI